MAGIGYAFISAYLKGEESRMISSDHLNAVVRVSKYQEAIDAIHGTDVGDYLEELDIRSFDVLDEELWKYFGSCLSKLEWFNNVPKPARKILNAYTKRYDVLNIKTALQNILTGSRTRGIPTGSIYINGQLDNLLNAESLDDITAVLNACGMQKYATILEDYRQDEGIRKGVLTDTGMEAVYFKELMDAAGRTKDSDAITKVFRVILDMTNLQVILRAVVSESTTDASGRTIEGGYLISDTSIKDLLTQKAVEIPSRLDYPDFRNIVEEIITSYEKDGDISAIDESIDKHRFRIIREILSPRIMSPAVLVWYLILKEIEIRNIRLVLKVVLDNISPEKIKDYLVY